MVNKKFIIRMGLQWGKATQVTPSGCFIHHIANRCISAAGTTSGLLGRRPLMLKELDLVILPNKKKRVISPQNSAGKSETRERKTDENLLPFLFLRLSQPCVNTHTHTHTHSEFSFLSVDGLSWSTACTGNWKCHCLCLWRKRNRSFSGCCQLAHISLLCYQEGRTEALTVQFLTLRTPL